MKPLFHSHLINGHQGDPALYLDFMFERRALLLDLGDIHRLSAKKILRISDVFISHTHMDHFIGFDRLLRNCLGRNIVMRFYGPAGFLDQLESRLNGYSWNLVENYDTDFTIEAMEIVSEQQAIRASFHCLRAFQRQEETAVKLDNGKLFADESITVHAAILDHKIPCLGFRIQEKQHINVWKNRLQQQGLSPGPWLNRLKEAVKEGLPDDTAIEVTPQDSTQPTQMPLGRLKQEILQITPGQSLAYVTDVIHHQQNEMRIVQLAQGANQLFIEAPFLQQDADQAAEKYHLTAAQAGHIARKANVDHVQPFHFSSRYEDTAALKEEVYQSFGTGI